MSDKAALAPPVWWETASTWIDQQVSRQGEIELVRVSDFSVVARVPAAEGTLYFKAAAAPFAQEAALTQALASWFPAHIPRLAAVDVERGWLLMHDVGATLRQITETDNDLSRWEGMLRQLAALQQRAASHSDDLLRLGIADRRLATLPAQFYEATNQRDFLLIDQAHEDSISEDAYQTMRAYMLPTIELCKQLATFEIPETLHHDDCHANNMAIDASGTAFIFFDWGESAIAHPFFSLHMVLRYAHYVFHAEPITIQRLRDLYLAAWTTYAPLPRLVEAYATAAQLGKLCRALTWHQAAAALPAERRTEAAGAATYWFNLYVKNAD